MSQLIARQFVERVNMRPVMFAPNHVNSMMEDLRQLADSSADDEQNAEEGRQRNLMAAYGVTTRDESKPYVLYKGIAVIPVHGTLINRFGASWGYITGYNYVRAMVNTAIADPDVKQIILDINSYGGEVAGCFELAADINAAKAAKPIHGVVDASCYSAAFAVGSSCTTLTVTPTGGVGSVGVVCMHLNMKGLLDNMGLSVEFIYAGDHKVDGHPYDELPKEVRADVQASVNKSYDNFVALVAQNRGLDDKVVRDTQARCYRAEEALELGLIDAIMPSHQAISVILDDSAAAADEPENKMSADNAAAEGGIEEENMDAAQAKKAERERISGIMNCDAAKGKSKLASHLALDTDMSVEQAQGILAAAGPESAQEPDQPEGNEGGNANAGENRFEDAMDRSNHPNMSADDGLGDADENAAHGGVTAAASILGAFGTASGRKFETK